MASLNYAVARADELIKEYNTRDPFSLALSLGVLVKEYDFKIQKGVYVTYDDCRMIFYASSLNENERNIVVAHELGHDQINRESSVYLGNMSDNEVFALSKNVFENEANAFAATLLIPDEDILEYIYSGYDIKTIAGILGTHEQLVAMKAKILFEQNGGLPAPDIKADFLK